MFKSSFIMFIVLTVFYVVSCDNSIQKKEKDTVPDNGTSNFNDQSNSGNDESAVKPDSDGENNTKDDTSQTIDESMIPDNSVFNDEIIVPDKNVWNDEATVPDEEEVPDEMTTKICEDAGGFCVQQTTPQPPECPNGSIQDARYECDQGGWAQSVCCFSKFYLEITSPTPVPQNLTEITCIQGRAASGGSGTPEITSDISGPIFAVGHIQSDNRDGCDSYNFTAMTNSIVLIERGNCQFSEKLENAAAAGAAVAVIYNNQDGDLEMQLNGTIPAVSISKEEGQNVYNFIQNAATATIHVK